MIVSDSMFKEYKTEYENEAIKIYRNIEDAINDFEITSGCTNLSPKEIECRILDDTNCDWKVMPDGRIFCSYIKAEA